MQRILPSTSNLWISNNSFCDCTNFTA